MMLALTPHYDEAMLEEIGDPHLVRMVKKRLKQKNRAIEVTLDELLGGITAKNLHKPIDIGAPLGKEDW